MGLQRSFVGMSDHIGRYEGGNVRQELSPVLQPIFSVEDFLNPFEFLRTTAALTAVGQAVVFTVPEGELWRVRSIHCEWNNTGGAGNFQGVVNPDGVGLVGLERTNDNLSNISANVTGYVGVFFKPDPFVIKGAQSAQIGFQASSLSAGTANIDLVVSRQIIHI